MGQTTKDLVNKRYPSFASLPDIVIQDSVNKVAYFLPATKMESYRTNGNAIAKITPSTVTFVIPDNAIVDLTPPFNSHFDPEPSILIQHHRGKCAYFLTFNELQEFRSEWPPKLDKGVSFILPAGMELIEELPALMKGLLQSNTSGGNHNS